MMEAFIRERGHVNVGGSQRQKKFIQVCSQDSSALFKKSSVYWRHIPAIGLYIIIPSGYGRYSRPHFSALAELNRVRNKPKHHSHQTTVAMTPNKT